MASEVDICNVALGHLGDEAAISAIDPPDGSVQASHCARIYPMARDELIEMHNWRFAVKRKALALLATTEQPQTLWASQTSDFENHSPDSPNASTGVWGGTVEDDDALDYTISDRSDDYFSVQ